MRAVMVATVKGPDTGASVVASILHSMPSYHFQGFVPGNGWVHLDEFAQRWLTLREKMTNPANPDYIHFSQFVATPDDGIAPDIEDSDFRTEAELFRRKVKPAWIQYFNTSKVMCAIRRLVIEANAPPPGHAFGFTHAFEDDGEQDDTKFAPPSHRGYTPSRALRSLDLFLRLFPRGRIIVHLPVNILPSSSKPLPHCMCEGNGVTCRALQPPDRRARMISQLLRYNRFRPRRTLLIAASHDFRNLTALTHKVASFLGEQPTSRKQTRKWLSSWIQRMKQREVLDVQHALRMQRSVNGLSGATMADGGSKTVKPVTRSCQRAATRVAERLKVQRLAGSTGLSLKEALARTHRNRSNAWDDSMMQAYEVNTWCAPFRCERSTANIDSARAKREFCTTCPLSLSEWAWSRRLRSALDFDD